MPRVLPALRGSAIRQRGFPRLARERYFAAGLTRPHVRFLIVIFAVYIIFVEIFGMLYGKSYTADYVVLEFTVKLGEIAAPAPNADDQVSVFFGVLLRFEKVVAVDNIEL